MSQAVMARKAGWALDRLMRMWGSADDRMTNQRLSDDMKRFGKDRSAATISRWRHADAMPLVDNSDLAALCEALDCEIEDLLELR